MTPFTAASGRCHLVLRVLCLVVISDAWRQRFGGTARLYGEKSAAMFADAHVCVVGIGGVGSWAAEALARTGIGAITLIDMDDVCVTNTNRQIHALSGNVGLAKAEVMAERIRLINPECRVTVVDDFRDPGKRGGISWRRL